MSRTTLCVITAAVLAGVSLSISIVRAHVMGDEGQVSQGPNTYKITLRVGGNSTGDTRLSTACPLDYGRQHIFSEDFSSDELAPKPVDHRQGERRGLQWTQRLTASKGRVQARYEFRCTVNSHHPTAAMTELKKTLYAAPKAGEDIHISPGIDPSQANITELALELTSGREKKADVALSLFHYVQQNIAREPGAGGSSLSAAKCLHHGRGDALGMSRLLAALCRNRGIPARLVTGLTLSKTNEQRAHVWVEAWVGDYWLPMCPFHNHFGKVPPTYLVFGFGDMTLVRGSHVRELDYAYLVQHMLPHHDEAASSLQQFFTRISLYSLPPPELRLVEFLLLLPLAALIICIYRNLIGLQSFGTFAPALIGLAFREFESLPGILVFVSILLIGWGMRRILDRYHLLQVPRTAFMLSMVIALLVGLIVTANYNDIAPTRYISLFPLVILTGMIERFWTTETEDGTWASFKTLLATMFIAATVSMAASFKPIVSHLVEYPETLILIMACQLLIGRYTGYRLMELYRFRDFVRQPAGGGH